MYVCVCLCVYVVVGHCINYLAVKYVLVYTWRCAETGLSLQRPGRSKRYYAARFGFAWLVLDDDTSECGIGVCVC